jgi:hypothetical protein
MSDIATLGIKIDSSQAATAAKTLDQFAAAGAKADAAAAKLTGSTGAQAAGTSKLAAQLAALDKLQKVVEANQAKMTASGTKAGAALGVVEKSAGLARHELINLSRQVQDVGVSLASGQSPLTVLFQQGAQIGDIFSSTSGTMKGFGAQVASIVTPMRLLGLGTVAAGAAALLAVSQWKSYALQLDDTARIAGTTVTTMSALQAAASFKGISQDEFTGATAKLAQNIYLARTNAFGLADVLRANGMHAKTFEESMDRVADLIQRSSGDTQKQFSNLQQVGLPATMQWVRFLEQGSAGLAKARAEATAFGENKALSDKAKAFDEAWNKATTNLSLYFKSAVNDALLWLDKLIDKSDEAIRRANAQALAGRAQRAGGNPMQVALRQRAGNVPGGLPPAPGPSFASRFPTAAEMFQPFKPAIDPEAQKRLLQMEIPKLGPIGELPPAQSPAKEDTREAA